MYYLDDKQLEIINGGMDPITIPLWVAVAKELYELIVDIYRFFRGDETVTVKTTMDFDPLTPLT